MLFVDHLHLCVVRQVHEKLVRVFDGIREESCRRLGEPEEFQDRRLQTLGHSSGRVGGYSSPGCVPSAGNWLANLRGFIGGASAARAAAPAPAARTGSGTAS